MHHAAHTATNPAANTVALLRLILSKHPSDHM
jgi:hypothetical protein